MKNKYMRKLCNYCKSGKILLHDDIYKVDVCIVKDKIYLVINNKIVKKHLINYCPICKDKLYIGGKPNKGCNNLFKYGGCVFCDEMHVLLAYYDRYYNTIYQVFIEGNKMKLHVDYNEVASKTINRCPICRHRLKKN